MLRYANPFPEKNSLLRMFGDEMLASAITRFKFLRYRGNTSEDEEGKNVKK